MNDNYLYICTKRWDDAGIRYLHNKSHMDFCRYLPVDYIDPLDWHLRAEDIFQRSDCGRIYTYVAIPRRWKDTIVDILQGYGEQSDGFRYKARKALINLDRIGQLHGIADLESQSNNPDKQMPIIYAPNFDASCLFDIRNKKITKFGYIKDEHTVASGSYNVGVGQTYTTWAAAFTDIATILTGNLTFTQQSAVTETASHSVTESLAGNILTCTSALNHLGNPNSGYLISTNLSSTATVWILEQEGPGTFNINKLYFKKISAAGAMSFFLIRNIATGCTLNINNNLFDGNGSFGNLGNAISLFDDQQGANIYNNKIWDCYTGTAAGIGILACDAANTIVENNTIINCGSGGGIKGSDLAATYRNNLVLTPNSGNCWNTIANAKGYNNCSTDTTGENADFTGGGSGNISSATALNEVISVTDTDATFLQVRTDATNANDGGTTPSIAANMAGIEGNVRPRKGGTYSIGASQWASASGGYAGYEGKFSRLNGGFN
jgi:hypothetical protein